MYPQHLANYIQARNKTADAYEAFSDAADVCEELSEIIKPDENALARIDAAEDAYLDAKNHALRMAFKTINAAEKTINALVIEVAQLQKQYGEWPRASDAH